MTDVPAMDRAIPLCVDLDGTLVRVDTLPEQALHALSSWSRIAGALKSLARGRAAVKQHLANAVPFSPENLPYHLGLLEWLRTQRAEGRRLVLVTAADQAIANEVSRHLGIFDEVIASDGTTNLKGPAKARRLSERFGPRRYAYVGNDRSDLPVWQQAATAVLVAASPSIARRAARMAPIEQTFSREGGPRWRAVVRALRPKQWAKNLLVFVPVVTARAFRDSAGWFASAEIFLAFCALASSAYLINDLSDLSSDRVHPSKRNRPIAAGALGVPAAVGLAILLAVGGFVLAWSSGAWLPTLCYLIATLGYSFGLKTLPLVDVFTLGGLYTLRVIAGGQASGHKVSEWLLAFSGFLFVALSCMKRVAELRARERDGGSTQRRPYEPSDLRFLETMGMGASVTSSLVLALFAQVADAGRSRGGSAILLWSVSPVMLFWQMRLWLSTFRGYMHEDPITYALGDWVTRLSGLLVIVLFILSGL